MMASLNVSVDSSSRWIFREQIPIESAQRLGYEGLKEKQLEAIVTFLATQASNVTK